MAMALFLGKQLSHSLPFRLFLLPLLRLSTEATEPNHSPFLTQYLVSSFGFSHDRALKVATSPLLSIIKTRDRPEAVVCFLKETGLTDSQIKRLISWNPQLLACSVSNRLEPKVHKLVAAGFTGETLTRLILHCPSVLLLKSAVSRLQFWRNYVASDDALIAMILRNHRLLQCDINKAVIPVMNLLKDYGFSESDIKRLYTVAGDSLRNPDIARRYIEETEALGFSRESRMFHRGLMMVSKYSRDNIMRKLEFFRKNYGWSDQEVRTAFRKCPCIVGFSEKTLKSKMDFLLRRAGLNNQNIITCPVLLSYSLERRLVPRHYVLSVLKMKGLSKNICIYSVASLPEEEFLEKFVRSFKKKIPDLEELYASVCQGKKFIQDIPEFQGIN